jgi:colanic acid biosynthesis glycosyl transferase WcaI
LKILFITQVFYPDTVATGQVLWDVADFLTSNGHKVDVITSRYSYEDKDVIYLKDEIKNGVNIKRINHSKMGKANSFYRLVDFFTFNFTIFIKLLFIKRKGYDAIIGTTVPPFLALIGVWISKLKNIPFYYYVMDLQPELSIASGMLKPNSIASKLFAIIGDYSIRNSKKLISLDKYMTEYLIKRGANSKETYTIPIWPLFESRHIGNRLDNPFRVQNDFGNRIVVMYSGNHAYVHPLDTLLEAALELKENKDFLFVFVGGGVRKKDVSEFKIKHNLTNILQIPFQSREYFHVSLAASDIQVIILGDQLVGYTHPNKIYGALFAAKPILYIGPKESHVSDILKELDGNMLVEHQQSDKLIAYLMAFSNLDKSVWEEIGNRNADFALTQFSPIYLKNKVLNSLVN